MHSFRPPRGDSPPAALPAVLRATHLLGLALGSALGTLRDSAVTVARMFERAEGTPCSSGWPARPLRSSGRAGDRLFDSIR